MKKWLVLVMCCAFTAPVAAQDRSRGTAVISGKVTLSHGRVFERPVQVRLYTLGGEERAMTFTDTSGLFRFDRVEPADYRVVAEAQGFRRAETSISIVPVGQGVSRDRSAEYRVRLELVALEPDQVAAPVAGKVRADELSAPPEALKEFQKGIELGNQGEWEKSAQSLAKALKLHPIFYRAALFRGLDLLKLKKTEEARRQLREAITLCPDCGESYVGLSQAEMQAGNASQAMAVLLEGQQRLPKSPPILLEACRIQLLHKNLDAASQLCQLAHEFGDQQVPQVHLLLAQIFQARGNPDLANEQLKQFLKEVPEGETARQVRKQLGLEK
jgi:Tfp pilus assembly protein PilF